MDENCGDVFFVRTVHDIEKCCHGRTENNSFTSVLVEVGGILVYVVIRNMFERLRLWRSEIESSFVFNKKLSFLVNGDSLIWAETQFLTWFQTADLLVRCLKNIF